MEKMATTKKRKKNKKIDGVAVATVLIRRLAYMCYK